MALRRRLTTALLSLLAAYAGVCLLVYVFQERLVYFPDRSVVSLALGPDVEATTVRTEDGEEIVVWIVSVPEPEGAGEPEREALVFCHGNAGNIVGRLPSARAFRDLGRTVFLFDYRGYGASTGSPNEEGTYRDAEAVFDLARSRGFEDVAVYGESLGCAIAIELALRRPVSRLVLESGFTSVPDLGASVYPWLPVRWLARVRYENERKIRTLDVPMLLVHSPADGIVPFTHAERLLAAAPAGTELLRTEGGHNDGGLLRRRDWLDRVGSFLRAR